MVIWHAEQTDAAGRSGDVGLPRRTNSRNSAHLRGGALLAVACTSALLLSACSDNAGTASSGSTTPPGSTTTTPSKTTKAPETKQSPKLPGTKEFGLTEQEFADHVEKTQALITTCMSEAGFEYIPVDVKTVEAAQARVRHDPGMTRAQYKAKWGLAVSTRRDNPVRDTGLGPQNLRIFNSLAPANKVAYNRTLFGEDPNADFVFTLDEEDFSGTGGCTRAAVAKVFTPAQVKGTYVNPKDVLVQADKRIVAARQAWSKCMKAAGYDYVEDQDEIIGEYEERLDKLLDGDDPDSLTGERAAALKKLQKEEIAVSLADLDCQLKHTEKVFDQVETEVYGHPLG